MKYTIQTKDLSKKIKNQSILENVNINVECGKIYALLGKNGAGKTTLMKLLLGLLETSSGLIKLFDSEIKSYKQIPYERIGNVIENPTFYPNLTGTENLELMRRMKGVSKKESVKEAMEVVGLQYGNTKRVVNYSLGMKQRLGIANAIMNEPELLILDEPINSLDPTGILEIRKFLMEINQRRKTTILISSHILSEISELADVVGFLHNGKLLEERSMASIKSQIGDYAEMKVSSIEKTAYLLENRMNFTNFRVMNEETIRLYEKKEVLGEVNRTLNENGIIVSSVIAHKSSLEDYFIKITSTKEK